MSFISSPLPTSLRTHTELNTKVPLLCGTQFLLPAHLLWLLIAPCSLAKCNYCCFANGLLFLLFVPLLSGRLREGSRGRNGAQCLAVPWAPCRDQDSQSFRRQPRLFIFCFCCQCADVCPCPLGAQLPVGAPSLRPRWWCGAAHQAPPSLGLSRQEHWSGLPFPSPMHESEK